MSFATRALLNAIPVGAIGRLVKVEKIPLFCSALLC